MLYRLYRFKCICCSIFSAEHKPFLERNQAHLLLVDFHFCMAISLAMLRLDHDISQVFVRLPLQVSASHALACLFQF